MGNINVNEINIANLAYLGDGVYELEIRNYLLRKSKEKVNILKEKSVKYVSAKGQSKILDNLLKNNQLSELERELVNRARNYRPASKPKNVLIKDYKKATALEALFGMLYINEEKNRIKELIMQIMEMGD